MSLEDLQPSPIPNLIADLQAHQAGKQRELDDLDRQVELVREELRRVRQALKELG